MFTPLRQTSKGKVGMGIGEEVEYIVHAYGEEAGRKIDCPIFNFPAIIIVSMIIRKILQLLSKHYLQKTCGYKNGGISIVKKH